MLPYKICCIQSFGEVELAIQYGASTVGLVGPMPSGPGPIPFDKIREIVRKTENRIRTWYLTSKTSIENILMEYDQVMTSGIQLTDEVDPQVYIQLKNAYPNLHIVQVRHVQANDDPEILSVVHSKVDAILLDSGSPNKNILGGTGIQHDWKISQSIVEQAKVPVYLAGGLNPDNASQAANQVGPYGLDVCSGLRVNGYLEEEKLKAWSKSLKLF